MKKCYTFIADGNEEGEYINVVDILKRAGIETKTISITNSLENNKRIAAICAAPAVILGHHGFLKNKKATCYPGFEQYLKDAIYYPEKVITDGLISTARGLGASIDLGLEIIKLLFDEKKSIDIAKQIQYLI